MKKRTVTLISLCLLGGLTPSRSFAVWVPSVDSTPITVSSPPPKTTIDDHPAIQETLRQILARLAVIEKRLDDLSKEKKSHGPVLH
jgi:hypothetical protein